MSNNCEFAVYEFNCEKDNCSERKKMIVLKCGKAIKKFTGLEVFAGPYGRQRVIKECSGQDAYVTPARAEELCQVLPRPGIADDKALEMMREIVMQNLAQPQVLEGGRQAFDPVALFGGSKGKDE